MKNAITQIAIISSMMAIIATSASADTIAKPDGYQNSNPIDCVGVSGTGRSWCKRNSMADQKLAEARRARAGTSEGAIGRYAGVSGAPGNSVMSPGSDNPADATQGK